jgi:hypothetical protein
MVYHGQTDARMLETFARDHILVADEVIRFTSRLMRLIEFYSLSPWVWRLVLKLTHYVPLKWMRGVIECIG